jgi:hypothetical protein
LATAAAAAAAAAVPAKTAAMPAAAAAMPVAAAAAEPAAVVPFTKQVVTNTDGKAVLLLHNPRPHTPGTYRVVATATVDRGTLVQSNAVKVTWNGDHHDHSGGDRYGSYGGY